MRRAQLTMVVVVLLTLSIPTPSEAQFGGFIDKIQKLSGPRFSSYGIIYRLTSGPLDYQPGQKLSLDAMLLLRSLLQAELASAALQSTLQMNPTITVPAETLVVRRRAIPGVEGVVFDTVLVPARAIPLNLPFAPQLDARVAAVTATLDEFTLQSRLADAVLGFEEGAVDRLRAAVRRNYLRDRGGAVSLVGGRSPAQRIDAVAATAAELRDSVARLRSGTPVDDGAGFVARLGLFYRYDKDNASREKNIYDLSLQPTVEYRFKPDSWKRSDIGIEGGVTFHYYVGDIDDPFLGLSFPLLLNYHPFARCSSWLLRNFRIGAGLEIYPGFDADDFAPAIMRLDETGWEFPLRFLASVDISKSSLQGAPTLACE